jgi:hypothetical protein
MRVAMFTGIDIQVLRASWLAFLPLTSWVCGFIMISFWGKAERRRLLKIMLWALPLFLFQFMWALYIMVTVSKHPL